MGVSISCKKTGNSISMGYFGFLALREKVAELAGGPFAEHYSTLKKGSLLPPDKRKLFYDDFNKTTEEIVRQKQADIKIVDFCLQSDCGGKIRYGACKNILKAIGDYDDDVCYGYLAMSDCAMFSDFKKLLQECVDTKSDLIWY